MTAEDRLYFEIARLFPAFKPHEVAALPMRYYLKLRSYLVETRQREQEAMSSTSLDEPGFEVIDMDKQLGIKSE